MSDFEAVMCCGKLFISMDDVRFKTLFQEFGLANGKVQYRVHRNG